MGSIQPLFLIAPASAYALWRSYENITRLQQYESQSEKAAEWSNTAAERLHKTRTTQGSAAITIALSLLTSLLLFVPSLRTHALGIALVNAPTLTATRIHFGNFWNMKNQAQVPFVEKFNEAIRGSEDAKKALGVLAWGWGVSGVCWWIGSLWGLEGLIVGGALAGAWQAGFV
ncbi:hypothetical protein BDV96DRAFT_617519 [Lophiotrema nucula]|uniref:Uncharacterized protein n=1 Tax=Lophiotrema nucula TaxID=690887 RepID=A0A6A5YGP8_9PLEO|nr:hypothetical protein BDV96DRAFT_617519 [Lophiotrema nucula]